MLIKIDCDTEELSLNIGQKAGIETTIAFKYIATKS